MKEFTSFGIEIEFSFWVPNEMRNFWEEIEAEKRRKPRKG